ncbi:RHS repeat-associated core domain-containing protein, partial [Thiolapillus sp.]
MNGRVYDPQLGRFLSADPFIQFADNSQSYSRYSYVLNNPLSSTDPSGHFAFLPVLINVAVTMASEAGAEAIAWNIAATTAISTTEMAVIQTAIQAGLSGLAQGIAAEAMGGTFAQGFEAGVLSGVQSGIYDGIGGAESLNGTQIPGLGAGITVERVLAHGLVGGAFARVRGDSFESGFASGVFSKLTEGRIQENISNKY